MDTARSFALPRLIAAAARPPTPLAVENRVVAGPRGVHELTESGVDAEHELQYCTHEFSSGGVIHGRSRQSAA